MAKKKGRPDYSIQIKKWWIGNGKIRFSDNFIKPRYTANLVDLRGTVSGLTTNPDKQAVVDELRQYASLYVVRGNNDKSWGQSIR